MKFLLRLKHWQLFLLTWGIPILMDVFLFSNPELLIKSFPLMMGLFMFVILGWIWAIATVLHKKLQSGVNLNLVQFKVFFSIPTVYMVGILCWLTYGIYSGEMEQSEGMGTMIPVVITIHLISMVCIFLSLRFAAKTLKSVELGRMARFSDYAGEFFLIWFSIIGMWALQPRLNKLVEEKVDGDQV